MALVGDPVGLTAVVNVLEGMETGFGAEPKVFESSLFRGFAARCCGFHGWLFCGRLQCSAKHKAQLVKGATACQFQVLGQATDGVGCLAKLLVAVTEVSELICSRLWVAGDELAGLVEFGISDHGDVFVG